MLSPRVSLDINLGILKDSNPAPTHCCSRRHRRYPLCLRRPDREQPAADGVVGGGSAAALPGMVRPPPLPRPRTHPHHQWRAGGVGAIRCLPKLACQDGIQTGPFGSQLHQSDYTEEGMPVVMPKDIINFCISLDAIARVPESLADSLGRHRMQEGDVVYGRLVTSDGAVLFLGGRLAGFAAQAACALRPNQDVVVPVISSRHLARPIRQEPSRRVRRVRRCPI